ncbi:hypothetical protein GGX14DRAFT_698027 [Mycena pura]|uniref:DUF6533 domain-containing protein n=1 Tax=Mycena pura TaxID=153505 RepID=A0AAD6YAB3_9AGAR|nr:hypothetical protein GGX14DRAFT_698027 [Mycena pura]
MDDVGDSSLSMCALESSAATHHAARHWIVIFYRSHSNGTAAANSVSANSASFPLLRHPPLSPWLPMEDQRSDTELVQLVADSRLTGYFAMASLCVLIYEHINCFADEVELMWKSRRGVAKMVYLWNRYFSLIAISLNASVIVREIDTATVCLGWLKVQGVTSTVIIATVDFVLMLRYPHAPSRSAGTVLKHFCSVWILYGRPRALIWLFAAMATAEVVTMIVVDFFAYAQMTEYVHLGPILTGCYAYNVPRFLTIYAAVPLFVTFIMFAMTLYKCITALRREAVDNVADIWELFLRDGIIWFLAVFLAACAALLIWVMRRETLKQLLVVPALVVYSTVASRTLLHIKEFMAHAPARKPPTVLSINEGTVDSGEPIFVTMPA